MRRRHMISALALLSIATVTACDFGAGLNVKDGEVTTEFHYTLRTDELVQETVDFLNDFAAKAKGELINALPGEEGTTTVKVLDKLPLDADVVFVVDNTGSMFLAIAKVQLAITEVMKVTPNRQYGVVTYRDRGDSYISKVQAPLSADLNAALAGVDAMEANEGGDFPEFVAAGLDAGLKQPWRAGKEHHIILIGDAPDKGYMDDPITMDGVAKDAVDLGVVIHAIGVPCSDVCKKEIGAK